MSVSGNNHSDLSARKILHNQDRLASPHISAIATFHHEGMLALWMLENLRRVRQHLTDAGFTLELICVLDSPDVDTRRIVSQHPILQPHDIVLEVDNRDLGKSRNDGFALANGYFGGTLDGDDYYSANWLTEAYRRVRQFDRPVIVHPDMVVSFGTVHCVTKVIDQSSDNYPISSCLKVHPWVSCSFAPVSVYRDVPYQPTDVNHTGYGYEDWHWNLETLADDIRHVTAPGTALFYRCKPVSMLSGMKGVGAVVRPTRFFDSQAAWMTRV